MLERPRHLTYCTNVHAGESLSAVEAALQITTSAVKERFSPELPFNVGLRLAAAAATTLQEPGALEAFRGVLSRLGLVVTTLNGFPYGAFHGTRVKENVYRPDWLEESRVSYTNELANVLAALLPVGEVGSISTVPGCFRPRVAAHALEKMRGQLTRALCHLVRLERDTGKRLVLALEPEPSCFLEETEETLRFFRSTMWTAATFREVQAACGGTRQQAEARVHRHLGVCLDACHAAVEFESPLDAWHRYRAAGVCVPKIQVSAGLRLIAPDREAFSHLLSFDEEVYLHQVVVRSEGRLHRFVDLPEALAKRAEFSTDSEWRVHFHVPVFASNLGAFTSTQLDLVPLLEAVGRATAIDEKARAEDAHDFEVVPQLEVETYTWNVLPPQYREQSLVSEIVRELEFTAQCWRRGHEAGQSEEQT